MRPIAWPLSAALSLFALGCDDVGAPAPTTSSAAVSSPLVADREASSGKTDICHRRGDLAPIIITVSSSAVAAHLAHGDRLADPLLGCSDDPCAALPDGTMFCDGSGFITCQDGVGLYRDCAAGTTCRDVDDGILCDWPN